jgi:hypothetical protein
MGARGVALVAEPLEIPESRVKNSRFKIQKQENE